jgi:GT2 family glycosyltransferase
VESQEKAGDRRFKLIINEKNLGYAGGNNVGIKYALENGADFILILNPDTTVGKNLLNRLVKTMKSHKRIGILQPAIKEGKPTFYGGGPIKWINIRQPQSTIIPRSVTMKEGLYVMGSAMFIRKEVVEKVGLFDERYFLYFEDADYSLRARRAGYKLGIEKGALIDHGASASASSLGPPLLLRYHYRNAHLFNWENGPWYVKIALPLWPLWVTIKQLLKIALVPSKREVSKAILGGIADFYRHRFGKIYW